MSIALAARRIKRNLTDYGIAMFLRKGIQYLFQAFYLKRIYRIYRRDLHCGQWPEPSLEGIDLKVVGSGDTSVIRQIAGMEEWLEDGLKEKISKGLCVAALDGPRVAGFNLVAFKEVSIPLLGLKKRLRPHQAWSEQISVDKEFRKKGVATALRYHVFTELLNRGISRFYGGALLTNIASLKSAQKAGFLQIADVHYRKILNRPGRAWKRIRHETI